MTVMGNIAEDLKRSIETMEKGGVLPGGEVARVISSIAALEVEEGGPYSLLPGGGLDEADKGLNLLVAYFLALCDVHLPKLDDFIDRHSEEEISAILSEDELCSIKEKIRLLKPAAQGSSAIRDEEEEKVMALIWGKFKERFSGFSTETRELAEKALKKTIRGNPDKQMSLMSYYTKKALGAKGEAISTEVVADMGLANIFFWTAFITYDDFWDEDESADPKLLPIANVFARHHANYFCTLFPKEDGFGVFVNRIMDRLDAANAWETAHCRMEIGEGKIIIPEKLPDYGDLDVKYRPASGHILGSLAMLAMAGCADVDDMRNFISYFRHYLIAMQLNDDAHDWEEDLRRGHISTVVYLIIRDLKEKGWEKPEIDIKEDIALLRETFWFTTLPKYAELTIAHSKEACKALERISVFDDRQPLLQFPEKTEKVALDALREYNNSIGFLETFGKPDSET